MVQRKSKKTYHHKDLRNAIIEAATAMLRSKSIAELSMRELAQVTGVSHGAPYRHFSGRTELLAAIAAGGYDRIRDICESAARRHADDPLKALENAGIGYLLFVHRNPEVANLMFSGTLPVSEWPEELHAAAQAAITALGEIIELGIQRKLYADFAAEDLTMTSLATVHGLAMFMTSGLLSKQAGNEAALRRLAKKAAQILTSGMLHR